MSFLPAEQRPESGFLPEKEQDALVREQGEMIKLSMITKGYVRNMLSKVEIATLG